MLLEIIVSLIYFLNKVFLLLEKRSGWAIGIIASSLATIYFYFIELYIILSLEFACLIIMIYGFFENRRGKFISYLVYSIVFIVMIYLLISLQESGTLEFITSVSFIAAFLLLANNRWHLGWSSLGIAHFLMMILSYKKDQNFFAFMQALSVLICLLANFKHILKKIKFRIS